MSKKYEYHPFIITDPPEELRGWQYGVDNSKTQYDMQNGQKAPGFKSPFSIYMFALIAFMLFWCIYSLVFAFKNNTPIAMILANFMPSIFVIFVCGLIVVMSVFGLWGKFTRWALKKNMVSNKDGARARLEAEVNAADDNIGKEKALNIYEEYIEVINYGNRQVLDRGLLREVLIKKYGMRCTVYFTSMRGECVIAYADVPSSDIHQLNKIFGDMCKVEKYGNRKTKSDKELSVFEAANYERGKFEWDGGKVAGLVMGFICSAVGGLIVALHFLVTEQMPYPLGIFFIVGGLLVMSTVLSNMPVFKVFVIPLLFSIIFMGFPFMFVFSVSQSEGTQVVLPTFHEFLCSFTPLSGGIFFLAGIGLMFFLLSFYNLFKYLKYRK